MFSGVDLTALEAWMAAEGVGHGAITDARLLAGGTQNILLRFRRGERDYVLRRPPVHARPKSNETMRREARLLGALTQTDVPHARLIAACSDESVLGAAFYLMEPVDGFDPATALPDLHAGSAEVQYRMGLALVEALAMLGALDHVALGLADFGRADGYLERQVARWQSELDGYAELAGWPGPQALGDVAEVGRWLHAHRPASFVPGIMHGDFHMANVMFRPDSAELAAIVDWELATIGDPLVDLGWLLATWPDEDGVSPVAVKPWIGFPTAAQLIDRYAQLSVRNLSGIEWYAVFACYKLGILLEGTYARACAGKASVDLGNRLHERGRWLFARARRWMAHGLMAVSEQGVPTR